jgi:hypothetical protein
LSPCYCTSFSVKARRKLAAGNGQVNAPNHRHHAEECGLEAKLSRRCFFQICTASSLGLTVGCGTILYPERRYQPHGDLDLTVVALDTLGLLLFFIPGVIAFAVDFTTGAIYLPPHESFGVDVNQEKGQSLVAVQVPQQELTTERLEQVASRHAGCDVRLVAGEYKTAPLAKLEDFWTARKQLVEAYL